MGWNTQCVTAAWGVLRYICRKLPEVRHGKPVFIFSGIGREWVQIEIHNAVVHYAKHPFTRLMNAQPDLVLRQRNFELCNDGGGQTRRREG